MSKIDARNGAFGILAPECDNAIITGNFWAFDANKQRLFPPFFNYLTKTPLFVEFCVKASEGTTNRRYLQEDKFLAQEISVPTITEQQRIVVRIEELASKMEEANGLRSEVAGHVDALLYSAYGRIVENAPKRPIRELAPLTRRPITVAMDATYSQVAVRSFGRGTFHKPPLKGSDVTWQKPFLVKTGDVLISNIKAWEGAIAVARKDDDGRVGSHRYLTFVPIPGIATATFLCFHLLTPEGLREVGEASPGSADRNRTLNSKKFLEVLAPAPEYEKQVWFDALYGEAEKAKRVHAETLSGLDALMPSILDKAFRGEL